jgi:hypothetical protein
MSTGRRRHQVADIKRRPSTELKYSIKRTAMVVGHSGTRIHHCSRTAEPIKISVLGTGFFGKDTAGSGGIRTCQRHGPISAWLSLQLKSLALSRDELRLRPHTVLFRRHGSFSEPLESVARNRVLRISRGRQPDDAPPSSLTQIYRTGQKYLSFSLAFLCLR